MAFDVNNFAYASAHHSKDLPREWAYTTEDTAATVDTAGYFNEMVNDLQVGDVIKAFTNTGGTTAYKEFFVSQNDGTTVDVNDATDFSTTTDTD